MKAEDEKRYAIGGYIMSAVTIILALFAIVYNNVSMLFVCIATTAAALVLIQFAGYIRYINRKDESNIKQEVPKDG